MANSSRFGAVEEKFFIVVSEDNGLAHFPSRHAEESLAVNEARKLAKSHPGVKFLVFSLVDYIVADNVTVRSF